VLIKPGIGPADVLAAHSIPLISNNPGVGQNLQDQFFFGINRGISVPSTGAYLNTPSQQATALHQYLQNASGPYSSAGGYLSFEKLPSKYREGFSPRTKELLNEFPEDWPEVEYISPGFPSGSEDFPTIGAITAILMSPMSRGNVMLRSASISDPPVINLNWLTDVLDAEVMIAAFKRVREMWSYPALTDILVGPEIGPGEFVSTDAEILVFIKRTAQTIWHASSTCAMGETVEKGAVVDSQAKVFGVKGLRVVDNSIMPFSLPGHPQASVYMLAEKIAHDIRKSQNC
jgi:choline dehydrogenase